MQQFLNVVTGAAVEICSCQFCSNTCIVPLGFLQWKTRIAFPGESKLQQSRYPTYSACWMFLCFHNLDYWTFNMHTAVNSLRCTQECMDNITESAFES